MSGLWLCSKPHCANVCSRVLTTLEFTDPSEGLVHPPEHMYSELWQVLLTSALPLSHTVHNRWTTRAMKKKLNFPFIWLFSSRNSTPHLGGTHSDCASDVHVFIGGLVLES